jgi:hypothetical protein
LSPFREAFGAFCKLGSTHLELASLKQASAHRDRAAQGGRAR